MRIVVVGIPKGQRVIHWRGVVVASLMLLAAVTSGAWLMCLLLDRSFFLLPRTLIIIIPMLLFTIIGSGIKRGLKTQTEGLPSL